MVLAIDDDPNVIYLLQENLAEAGYQVIGATRGERRVCSKRGSSSLLPSFSTSSCRTKMAGRSCTSLKTDVATRDIPVSCCRSSTRRTWAIAWAPLTTCSSRLTVRLFWPPWGALRQRITTSWWSMTTRNVVDLVRQLLDEQPYEIEAAVDGQAALEAIAQRPPDVILLDLLMPRLDGFGVLEYLHHTPRYRDIPVIVLTAKICTAEEQALLHTRVRTVIQKQGLERDGLIQEVRAALLAYRATRKEDGMKTILIVEDVEFNLDLLVQLLEDDYAIHTATDGATGMALAEQVRPDLILMDLSLPVIDGWEATRRIKANARLRHIPIIALTAHAMSGDEERAKAAGCDDYLSKPIDEDLLFAKLQAFLGND